VLVVGLTRLAEVYLQAATEFAPETTRIAGILCDKGRHIDRLANGCPVLGKPSEVREVVNTLEVHGVHVDRIVVAQATEALSQAAREYLQQLSWQGAVRVDYLCDQLFLGRQPQPALHDVQRTTNSAPVGTRLNLSIGAKSSKGEPAINLSLQELSIIGQRRYWLFKRLMDVVAATVLLITLAPLMVLVAIAAAIDVGLPILFIQQRLGLAGVPFNVYKFRTLAAPFDGLGRRLPDHQRLSPIGRFARKSRLDEIPQLFQILMGSMSFVGPRPLLPIDQLSNFSARLLVRPGLTGWAQAMAGRDVSALDKMALDVWYVQHASLKLDAIIMLRTVAMILWAERIDQAAIDRAWRELNEAGLLIFRQDEHHDQGTVGGRVVLYGAHQVA